MNCGLAFGDDPSADGEQNDEGSDDGPAVFFKRIWGIDGNAEASAGTSALGLRVLVHWTGLGTTLSFGAASAGLRGLVGDGAGARDGEGQRLSGLGLLSDLDDRVGLVRVIHGLEGRGLGGGEVHGFGHDDDEVLGGIERLRIDFHRAVVRKSELQLELSLSGTQRKGDGVAAFFGLGDGFGGDGLSIGRFGLHLRDFGAGGQIELEIVIVHLGDGGRGSVVDGEQANALQAGLVGLQAEDVGGEA